MCIFRLLFFSSSAKCIENMEEYRIVNLLHNENKSKRVQREALLVATTTTTTIATIATIGIIHSTTTTTTRSNPNTDTIHSTTLSPKTSSSSLSLFLSLSLSRLSLFETTWVSSCCSHSINLIQSISFNQSHSFLHQHVL